MHKTYLAIGALLGAVTVALGAFGVHALKGKLSAEASAIFETAIRYQFYHVFALIATGILYQQFPQATTNWAGRFFLAGMLLFCGSLYVLTWVKAVDKPSLNFVGAITPLGGICFIAGWICLAASFLKN